MKDTIGGSSYNTNRKLLVNIEKIKIKKDVEEYYNSEEIIRKYVHNEDTEKEFEDEFEISLMDIQEVLFGRVTILFSISQNEKQMGIGISILKTQIASEKGFNPILKLPIYVYSYRFKAEHYDKTLIIGVLLLRLCIGDPLPPAPPPAPTKSPLMNLLCLFNYPGDPYIYKVIFRLFAVAKRGTIFCKLYWTLGLFSVEYYYNTIYGRCDISTSSAEHIRCLEPFCRGTYTEISENTAKKIIKYIGYSSAAFGNSLAMWKITKIRSLPHIKNRRKRSILERLDISEEDLILDHTGSAHSLCFIAFIDNKKMIVSFKGTTTNVEAIHDLNCEYIEFLSGYAHRGIKSLAERFISDYYKEICDLMLERNIKNLEFVGYSLGAGVAILIYLILKSQHVDRLFTMKAVVFSCPPIVSNNIAKIPDLNIEVYNYGLDIVTRLSLGSILDLKYLSISVGSFYSYFRNKDAIEQQINEIRKMLIDDQQNVKLYHAGTLMHINYFEGEENGKYCIKQVNYKFFGEILSSRKSVFDHFLYRIYEAASSVIKKQNL